MKHYKVKITKYAQKFIEKQPKFQRERIYSAIKLLPSQGDIQKMQGTGNKYRLRVGDYRIIYEKHDEHYLIIIIIADNRGDVYK